MQRRDLAVAALRGHWSDADALVLAEVRDIDHLCRAAAEVRDEGFGSVVTYSRKVFVPLTHLCRDVCHYCTFAQPPRNLGAPYMSVDEVLAVVRRGARMGCKEVLLTLGERPELRYREAREALAAMGFASTLDYVAHVAGVVLNETGLLPHINAGTMTGEEMAALRPVSASMGLMLESSAERLCRKGGAHFGSPDKLPSVRLETLRLAGALKIPMTSGILIGIGETRRERVETLLALRALHRDCGHIQEVIVQNFRAKPGTRMANAPEPDVEELLWTLAVARLILGPDVSIQAPPNLSPGLLGQLVAAGLNDWGGVSPLTPDFVNPEAPWPQLEQLAAETKSAGKTLVERLTIYPRYIQGLADWADAALRPAILDLSDGDGLARVDPWRAGGAVAPPSADIMLVKSGGKASAGVMSLVARARAGERLEEGEITRLFAARGDDFGYICRAADDLRREVCGDSVGYVVNRNINYTNICTFKCQFCAFSKGKMSDDLRGRPYDLADGEIARRVREAYERGASEVCMQGGIKPDYSGQKYLDIIEIVKAAVPEMHIHAFSPLEVWQGAVSLGLDLKVYLQQLKEAGLGSLPGTAAEILDDEVRGVLCPDKINTRQWLEVVATAHEVGLATTSTIMYGHVERPVHWARHLLHIRDLQARTGGITEFVPLPFVGMEAPIYLKGRSRPGPTFREAVLMHAVARLVLHPLIPNIQASWVKMGEEGVRACLGAGANDLGGTLMNESITRAAGAAHGQEFCPESMDELIIACGRTPRRRTTLYGEACAAQTAKSYGAGPLAPLQQTPVDGRRVKRLA